MWGVLDNAKLRRDSEIQDAEEKLQMTDTENYLGLGVNLLLLAQLAHVVLLHGHLVGREHIDPVPRGLGTQGQPAHLGPQQQTGVCPYRQRLVGA